MEGVTGIILAGGQSSRMGQDKSSLLYKDKALIQWSVDVLKPLCNQLLISTNNNNLNYLGFPIVSDEVKRIGPIGGLYSCLKKSNTRLNLIIACDTPYLSVNIYKTLLNNAKDGFSAVAVDDNGNSEPLIACYQKDVSEVIGKMIMSKKYKLQDLLNSINVNKIAFPDSSFSKNINQPEDLI